MKTKGYLSKSAIFLAMLVTAGAAQLTQAEDVSAVEPLTATNPASSTIIPAETTPLKVDNTPTPAKIAPISNLINPTSPELVTASADNATVTAPVEGQSVDVRILSTTDLHSNLVNYDYYQDKEAQSLGLAKTAVLIDTAKKENPNVVLVDNGDILQGTPLATYKAIVDPVETGEVHPMYAALKALNFDASTLGNHEFNYGLDYLDRVMATAGLPIVNTNVLDAKTGAPKFKPFDILTKTFTDKEGKAVSLKIGITGIVPPQIMSWDKANLTGKVTVKDAVEAVKEVIPTIRAAGADLVLVLAHTGIGDDVAGTRNDASAYTDIPAGPIAIKNVADLYLYDNVTAILKVTGADLKEWLEMSAGQFNTIDPTKSEPQDLVNTSYRTYNFDVIDGITYEFDVTQKNKYDSKGTLVNPEASRVRNLTYMGKAIDPKQEFMVVTNNYRASGNFPGVKNATMNRLLNLENRQAIINYIIAEKHINPSADHNWYFADTIKGLNLRFLSADKAKGLVSHYKDIRYLGPSSAEGFGDYSFTYVAPSQSTTSQALPGQSFSDQDRQAIHQLATRVYQETHQTASKKDNQLPAAGDGASNNFIFFGISLAGLAVLFGLKKEGN